MLILFSGLIVAVALMKTLHYSFMLDDDPYIVWNPKLASLSALELWRLFTEPYNDLTEFLPLRDFSYWFILKLSGQNPFWFRLFNISLYLACLPLIYGVTLRLWLYFRPVDATNARWLAAVTAALFALHPAHIEAMVWISGLKDVQSGMLILLSIWFAISARGQHGILPLQATAALIAMSAAILSKATAVAVAPILAALWLLFWRDIPAPEKRLTQLFWPVASLLLACGLAVAFASWSKEILHFNSMAEIISRSLVILGWLFRLMISAESRHFYYPVLEDVHIQLMTVLGAAFLAAIIAGMVAMLKYRSLPGFAAFSLLLFCLPSLQLIPYAPPSMASDRFVFLAVWPMLLLIVLLAWRLDRIPRIALLLVITLGWGLQTIQRPLDWRNLETLVDADLRNYPDYYMPAIYKIADFQLRRGQYQEAEQTARNISSPIFRDIMLKLIEIHHGTDADASSTGKLQRAMQLLEDLKVTLRQPPAEAQWNLPIQNMWIRMPFFFAVEWNYLVKRFPDNLLVSYSAGLWSLEMGRYPEAIIYLRSAIGLPSGVRGSVYYNLGQALMRSGDLNEAEKQFQLAVGQTPPDMRAYCALSEIYRQTGHPLEAGFAATNCHTHVPVSP